MKVKQSAFGRYSLNPEKANATVCGMRWFLCTEVFGGNEGNRIQKETY